MTTLSQIITTAPDGLRPFLQRVADNDNALPTLFATHTGLNGTTRRVRIVSASRLGRIGITDCLAGGSAQTYVPTNQLSQFLPTAYPLRRKRASPSAQRIHAECRASAAFRINSLMAQLADDSSDALQKISAAIGVPPLTIKGRSRRFVVMLARRVCVGVIAATRDNRSLTQLGNRVSLHHSTILHGLREIGLHGSVTDVYDMPYLRALWRCGRTTIGYEPGDIPAEVAERLGRFVTAEDGLVEPVAWTELRRHLALKLAADRLEELRCAA